MVFAADNVNTQNSGLAFGTAATQEFRQANQRVMGLVSVQISSASSLTGGFIGLQMFDNVTQAWVGCPQSIYCLTGGGSGVSGNTASAALVVGGEVKNTTGVTAITANSTFIFTYGALGVPVRLNWGASGGTASLAYEERGLTATT